MLNKRIKLLPSYTVNQIAAGEVIERPASVLKELLENSIDANATQIDVFILQGGLQSIEVRDNGQGICAEDLPLAITANATSKLQNIEDLWSLYTLGFRGEALASIDAVADLQITSRTFDDEFAWTITGGQVLPSSHPLGTSIKVSNLFYTIPVRKKFLKSARLEFIYLEQVWVRIALSNFNIGFSLYHNERLIKKLNAINNPVEQEQRLFAIMGNLQNKIIQVQANHSNLQLSGWIIVPEHAPSNTEHQYIYLNGRFVRDKLLIHAIKEAYASHLLPGKQALYCLYLNMPTNEFDVNVHPTKLEVRFKEPRVIHDFVMLTLCDCLQVPVSKITSSGYKVPLTLVPTQELKILTTISQRIVLIEEKAHEIIAFIDLIKLKNAILSHALERAQYTVEYLLAEPMRVNYDFAKISVQEFRKFGIVIEQLSEHTVIVRSVPQIIQELNLSLDCEKLFNKSKNTNLIDALCFATNFQTYDLWRLIELANNLEIADNFYKKSYNAHQLAKLLDTIDI